MIPDPIARRILPTMARLLARYEHICRYHYDRTLSPLWWRNLKACRAISLSVAQRLDYLEINHHGN